MIDRWFRRRSRLSSASSAEQAGFSLPELMLVLAIIMLLVTISMPRMRRAKQRAEEAAAAQTLKGIHTAQEAQRIMTGSYSPNFKLLRDTPAGSSTVPEGQTGQGSSGEDVMVHQGYIFRMERTAPDEYTVTAEPILERSTRPRLAMNQTGQIAGLTGMGLGGGLSGGGTTETGAGAGTPPPDEEKKDEQPPPPQ